MYAFIVAGVFGLALYKAIIVGNDGLMMGILMLSGGYLVLVLMEWILGRMQSKKRERGEK